MSFSFVCSQVMFSICHLFIQLYLCLVKISYVNLYVISYVHLIVDYELLSIKHSLFLMHNKDFICTL